MPALKAMNAAPKSRTSDSEVKPFELTAVERTKGPEGGDGENWCRYTIVQGPNTITGYRQGSMRAVKKAVTLIVADLNERRRGRTGRVHLRHSSKPKKASGGR